MKKQIVLSVIVPIYNMERYLERCLQSIVLQTYSNLEIILVNDGSTDNSICICREYAAKDMRIKVVDKENGGLISARKSGVKLASGDYITFVDSDDWLEKDAYERMVAYLQDSDIDILTGGAKQIYPEKVKVLQDNVECGVYEGKSLKQLYDCMLYMDAYYKFGVIPYVWCKFFKREIAQTIYNDIEENVTLGEDVLAVYPALLLAQKVRITKELFYCYRMRNDSMTQKGGKELLESSYNLLHRLERIFEKMENRETLLRQLRYYTVLINQETMRILYGIQVPNMGTACVHGAQLVGKRIIVYGAGKIGKRYVSRLIEQDEITLVAWVDKNYKYFEDSRGCLVESPDVISERLFDYIVLAVKDEKMIDEIIIELEQRGVRREKVVRGEFEYRITIK